MRILVVGKGGREHALVRALAESPGSPGLVLLSRKRRDFRTSPSRWTRTTWSRWWRGWPPTPSISAWRARRATWSRARAWPISANVHGIPCWGPPKESAQLEASKEFAKEFLQRHGIPTARATATRLARRSGRRHRREYPTVLKFDGLAAGKGVAVCPDEIRHWRSSTRCSPKRRFGPGRVLVEECLSGPEVSIFAAIVDDRYLIFTPARDYKRARRRPRPEHRRHGRGGQPQLVSGRAARADRSEIVRPTVAGLRRDGLPYRGFLYFGLMLTPDRPAGDRIQLPLRRPRVPGGDAAGEAATSPGSASPVRRAGCAPT
jgi:phosphoribosylamine---glycine ligase